MTILIFTVFVFSMRGNNTCVLSAGIRFLEQTIDGKAWLVIGNMDISPDQQEAETVGCTVLNLKNGEMFSPSPSLQTFSPLTKREAEILRLIQKDC